MSDRRPFPALAAGALLALAAAPAAANDGVPPEIFDLVQEGQDVVVTFGIVEPGGEPGIQSPFDLTRSGPEGEVAVFGNETFDAAHGEPRDPWCRTQDWWGTLGPEAYCAASPAECTDCDGDGSNECPVGLDDFDSFCAAYLTYEVVDHCVPAGTTEYELRGTGIESDYLDAEATIDVVASGEQCGPDDASTCSVAAVGARGGALPAALALLLGLVGLGALRGRRNG